MNTGEFPVPEGNHAPIAPNLQPEDDSPTPIWQKIVGVVAGAAAVVGGVTLLESNATDGPASTSISPTEELASRSVDVVKFNDDVLQYYTDRDKLADASAKIPHITGKDAMLGSAFRRAFDYATASAALEESVFTPDANRISLAQITDTGLRNDTEMARYTFKAEAVIDAINPYSTQDTLQVAEQAIAKAPAGADAQKHDALIAAETSYAKQIVGDYSDTLDPAMAATFQSRLKQITDPGVRQRVDAAVAQKTVADVLSDVYLSRMSPDGARTQLSQVADPALRDQALQAIATPDTYGYYEEAFSLSNQLDLHADDSLDERQTEFTLNDVADANIKKQTIERDDDDAQEQAKAAYSHALGAATHLAPAVALPAVQPLTDPTKTIDLSQISSTENVPNFSVAASNVVDVDNTPKTFNQFGEVYVKDGHVTMTFTDGVSQAVKSQFQELLHRNDAFLQAAFASGNLTSLRLVLDDSFNPYYDPTSREIIMSVSQKDPLSRDQESSALTHELTHSLLGDYFRDIDVSPAEQESLTSACATLQAVTYKHMQGLLAAAPDNFTDLRAQAKPEHRAVIDTLSNAVLHGSIQDLFSPDTFATTSFNDCMYSGSLTGLIDAALFKTKDAKSVNPSDLTYLQSLPAGQKIAEISGEDLAYSSVFAKLVNESNYVQTPSEVQMFLGHSRDNANELAASLTDVMINYPDKFKAGLDQLDADERAVMIKIMGAIVDAIDARYPSIRPMTGKLRQDYALAG